MENSINFFFFFETTPKLIFFIKSAIKSKINTSKVCLQSKVKSTHQKYVCLAPADITWPKDNHQMVNSYGKLRGKAQGPPKGMRIVWTAGWVEPGSLMVTIPLSAAPNPFVGPPG